MRKNIKIEGLLTDGAQGFGLRMNQGQVNALILAQHLLQDIPVKGRGINEQDIHWTAFNSVESNDLNIPKAYAGQS